MDKRTGRRRLLDNYELNLGQSAVIPRPQVSGVAIGDPIRLLDLRGDSEEAETCTVVMGATLNAPEVDKIDDGHQITGPLTGIVEFGSGAAVARVEFDIPPPSRFPFCPLPSGTAGGFERFTATWRSGTSLAVPGSSVRVMARNDNNMPLVTSLGRGGGTVIYGSSNLGDVDPTVFAFVSRFGLYGSSYRQLRKTVWIGTLQVNDTTANYCSIGIPAFARQACLYRTDPGATGLHLYFYDAHSNVVAEDHFSTNDWGPFDVPPWAAYCAVLNDGPAQATNIKLVFDLSI